MKTSNKRVIFYDEEKTKIYKIYDVNDDGEKCGLYESFYPNGQLKKVIHFYKNKFHGTYHYYYPNGQLKKFCFYDDDYLERDFRTY